MGAMVVALCSGCASQKLKAVKSRLEQDSIPLSWSELCAQFPDAEAHLAAQPQFFASLEELTNLPKLSEAEREMLPVEGSAKLPELGRKLPPAMVSALNNRLQEAGPALAAIRQAVSEEPFWLVKPPSSNLIFKSTAVRHASRLFKMSTILHSERDDQTAATDSVIDSIRLSQVLHRGSRTVDEIVRFSCEAVTISSLEYLLAKTDPSDESLDKLEAMLSKHNDMLTGILGEIVYTKQYYESEGMPDRYLQSEIPVASYELDPLQQLIVYLPVVSSGWIRMNEAYHLEQLHHVAVHWHLPWQEFKNRLEVLDSIPWPYHLPYSQENYSTWKAQELRAAGAWRCARIALAIKRYSQEHGNLPPSLADLVPRFLEDLPSEPFHGQPFEYTNDGETGTLRFVYPDTNGDFTFKVLTNKESTKPEN